MITTKTTITITFLFYLSFFVVWGYTGPASSSLPYIKAHSTPWVKTHKFPLAPKYYDIQRGYFYE